MHLAMFSNPALGSGGQAFIYLVIIVKAIVIAVSYVDYKKSCKRCAVNSREEKPAS